MPGTPTPRLSFPTLVAGSDNVSAFPPAFNAAMALADNAIPYSTGTLAARPAAPTVSPQVYAASDTGLTYWWNGTTWVTFLTANLVEPAGNYTAKSGDTILAPPGSTVSLAAASTYAPLPITIIASIGASGSDPVTISSVNPLFGRGLAASTALLGTPFAALTLLPVPAANDWLVIAGEPDSGWVPLTLQPGVTASGGYFTPAVRLVGNLVTLCGAVTYTASGDQLISTLPTAFRPASYVSMSATASGSFNGGVYATLNPSGQLSVVTPTSTVNQVYLDGVSYRLA